MSQLSSTATVRDLKVALCPKANAMPSDQLIYSSVGGSLLEDTTTLMQAQVPHDNSENVSLHLFLFLFSSEQVCFTDDRGSRSC